MGETSKTTVDGCSEILVASDLVKAKDESFKFEIFGIEWSFEQVFIKEVDFEDVTSSVLIKAKAEVFNARISGREGSIKQVFIIGVYFGVKDFKEVNTAVGRADFSFFLDGTRKETCCFL